MLAEEEGCAINDLMGDCFDGLGLPNSGKDFKYMA